MFTKFNEGQLVVATNKARLEGVCIYGPVAQKLVTEPFPFELLTSTYERDIAGQCGKDYVEGCALHPDGWHVPVIGLKKVVEFDATQASFITVGLRADVFAIGHDCLKVYGMKEGRVDTSRVIDIRADGSFETLNTVFVPKKAAA